MKRSKYHSKKVVIDGITFHSQKEGRRYRELLLLQHAGAITDLQRQVKYVLIPAQYSTEGFTKTGKPKCIERECSYIADFVYKDLKGLTIVEDTKGYRTTEYIIKRKLMLHVHGIRIREI